MLFFSLQFFKLVLLTFIFQSLSATSLAKISTESTTKSIVNSASTSSDKVVQVKSVSRIKLPMGVVPIPRMIDQANERNEDKNAEKQRHMDSDKNLLLNKKNKELKKSDKLKELDNEMPEGIDNGAKPKLGFQEIGDDPNHFGQMPGLDEGREGQSVDDQYEYDREQNNGINLEENEEDGDEDEDDQIEYRNNGKHPKQE